MNRARIGQLLLCCIALAAGALYLIWPWYAEWVEGPAPPVDQKHGITLIPDQKEGSPINESEAEAVAALERQGATVHVDAEGNVSQVHISDALLGEAELASLGQLPQLVSLVLMNCRVDDRIWPHLTGMQNLRILSLWGSAITDDGMENLRRLPRLVSLDLRMTKITDRGLAHVAQMNELGSLTLLGTKISSAGLAPLRGLTKLKSLCLVQTPVDDSGLEHIEGLTKLTELELEGTDITNEGLRHVGKLENLEVLSIHDSAVTEEGLFHLEGLQKLNTLYLCIPVTEVGLRSLKKLAKLQHLYISDVAEESRDFLRPRLPDVGVY